MKLKNSLFDARDDWYWPDRTMNDGDSNETLFEFSEGNTEQVDYVTD